MTGAGVKGRRNAPRLRPTGSGLGRGRLFHAPRAESAVCSPEDSGDP